jgi:hypothetical protein
LEGLQKYLAVAKRETAAQFLRRREIIMSDKNQSVSMEAETVEGDAAGPQTIRPAAPPTKRRRNYDGSKPLNNPGHEAVAQFLAVPKQFRRFRTITALAMQFNVARMTVYRWAQDFDVVRRAEWLSVQNQVLGDFIACREWPSVVRAQVAAALAGDTRAAIFLQNRAWPEGLDVSIPSLEEAVKGTINVGTFLEEDETVIQPEQSAAATANQNPDVRENIQEEEEFEE